MRRLLIVSILLVSACKAPLHVPQWANELLGDPPAKAAWHLSILCDHSAGSVCGEAELAANIDAALTAVADRPGSTVAIFGLGTDLATTSELGRITVPPVANRRERAQRAAQRKFVDAARAELLRGAQPLFASPPLRASPLAEAFTKIAYTRQVHDHTIVAITDALEYSSTTWDLECKKVPAPEVFVDRLQRLALFQPGTMRDTRIAFVNQRLGGIGENRCAQSMTRIAAVRAAWSAAGRAAGASVTFSSDAFGGTP